LLKKLKCNTNIWRIASLSNFKRKRWYTEKQKKGWWGSSNDPKEMLDFINQNDSEGVYYHVFFWDFTFKNRCYSVKPKTVRKIIDNGYTKIDLWCYANRLGKNWNGESQESYRIANEDAFVIDLDNCKYETIEELLEDFTNRKVPLPQFISQTSERSYHLLYRVSRDIFKFNSKLKLCYLICGLTSFPRGEKAIQETLEKFGIDYGYLKQDPLNAKFRVPGSINSDNCDFLVKGWFNKNYDSESILSKIREYVLETNVFNLPEKKDREAEVKIKRVREYKRFVSKRKFFEKLINENFKFKKNKDSFKINLVVDFFMDNLNRFIKKEMYISQQYWGNRLGTDQGAMSRFLKKLIEMKIIEVVDNSYDYSPGNRRCKVYGFTDEFRKILFEQGRKPKAKAIQQEILDRPYENGYTNTQMMQDMRILFLDRGWFEIDRITEFIYEKDLDRPYNKQRGWDAIRKFVENYTWHLNERYRNGRLEVV
jgi:DNA-binding MarR family transcriptional regulator